MPSVSKSSTVSQSNSDQPSSNQNTILPSPPIPSNCMKGDVKKTRARTRKRTRARRTPNKDKKTLNKDRKKMLPARVARLLASNAAGIVQIGKRVFCSSKDGKIGELARGHGKSIDIGSVCNVKTSIDNRTFSTLSGCQQTCGTFLCVGTEDSSSGLLGKSLLSTDSKTVVSTSTGSNEEQGTSSAPARTEKFVAIDCEMVGVGEQGSRSALGRCSIVNYDGDVLYDKYIKPDRPVTDYRTPWSGIVPEHMDTAIPFYQAKKEASDILKDKIIIGHDVQNDFSVLQLKHPDDDVRDTSRYRGLRYLGGVDQRKRSVSLKAMVEKLFGRKIQTGPHCSVEDARAAMSLYRLVDGQWEEDAISLYPDRQFRAGFLDDHFWPEDL